MSAVLPLPENKGWKADINIRFAKQTTKTVMTSLRHLGPLRVQRPFYPEQGVCHVYLLHPPGGVVGGDKLNIQIQCDTQSHALITTPGSTKFYRSAGDNAQLNQQLHILDNGILEWFPQENILFPSAKLKVKTEIHLQGNATFIGWDISCFGRPANNEIFDEGFFDSALNVFRDKTPVLIERQRLNEPRHLTASAGLRGYPMNGIFLSTNCTEEHLDSVNSVIKNINPDFPAAVTLLDDLLVLRCLGWRTETMQKLMIAIWQVLRPMIIKKPATLPRIWST